MKLKVVFISNWFNNPYKKLLANSLEKNHVYITETLRSTFFLPKILAGGKPDILHLQTLIYIFASRNWLFYWFKFLLFIAQLNVLKILGTKTVWTVHEWKDKISEGQHDLSPSKAFLLGRVLTSIITHCEYTKQEMITDLKLSQPEKAFVVPHGNYIGCYENTISQSRAREKLGLAAEVVTFLFFGGIHPSKGVLEAIDAFQLIAPKRQANLIIAGQIPYPLIKRSIKEKIAGWENILLFESKNGIPDNDVQIYLNACDVVILPYRIFTTSGVALLAMSFKKACIAPDWGFFHDILEVPGSFLYDREAENGLSQAIKQAIECQANLAEMGIHNYQLAKNYSWDKVARQTEEVYRWSLKQSSIAS